MRIALDTNILAYAEGVGDQPRCSSAIHLLEQLPPEMILLPDQTLGELFRGFTWRGITVLNPFTSPYSPLIEKYFKENS